MLTEHTQNQELMWVLLLANTAPNDSGWAGHTAVHVLNDTHFQNSAH